MQLDGGWIVIVNAKPSKKVVEAIAPLVLAHRCVKCRRKQVEKVETPATEFSGEFRFGKCPKCYARYRDQKIRLDETAAARFDEKEIKAGRLVLRRTVAAIREEAAMQTMAES